MSVTLRKMENRLQCDDCGRLTDINLLDAWAADENAEDYDALLCERCHNARPPSAWGNWCEGP